MKRKFTRITGLAMAVLSLLWLSGCYYPYPYGSYGYTDYSGGGYGRRHHHRHHDNDDYYHGNRYWRGHGGDDD